MLSLQYPLIIWFLKGITEKVSTSQSQEQEHRCTNVRAWGVGMAFGNLELLGWFCIWVLGDPYHFSRSPASRSELHLNLHLQPLPIPFITSLPLQTAWLAPPPQPSSEKSAAEMALLDAWFSVEVISAFWDHRRCPESSEAATGFERVEAKGSLILFWWSYTIVNNTANNLPVILSLLEWPDWSVDADLCYYLLIGNSVVFVIY